MNNLKNLDYKSGYENRIVEKSKRSHKNNQEEFESTLEKDKFKSENLNATTSKDTQTSLDFDSSCYSAINPSRNSGNKPFHVEPTNNLYLTTKQNLNKRNLTLEELEIEGFDGPDNQSLIVNPIEIPSPNKGIVDNGIEEVMDSDVSEDDIVSLNSLIEGDVDEVSDIEDPNHLSQPKAMNRQVIERVDPDDLLGEDEELVALSNTKIPSEQVIDNSDTEANFLDRDNVSLSKDLTESNSINTMAASAPFRANNETKPNTSNISRSVNTKDLKDKELADKNNANVNKGVVDSQPFSTLWQQNSKNNAPSQQQPLSYNTNSDFDSWSTTSASYTLSEPNSFLNISHPQQNNRQEPSKVNTIHEEENLTAHSRQEKTPRHQPTIRRVSSNSSDSSGGTNFIQEENQEGGAPLPMIMQNSYSEQAQDRTGERRGKHRTTNSSSSSTQAHISRNQEHVIPKLSSSETLPSDSAIISGSKSGCNIVYESSNPNKSANDKCFDNLGDGGKISNDDKSAGGSNGTNKLFESEKTNVLGATIKNSRQETSYDGAKRKLSPFKKSSEINKKEVEINKEEKSLGKNQSDNEDKRKGSNTGTKKKVSALIAKFEIPESVPDKEFEIESSKNPTNNSHKYPPLRNARSATPEDKLSPPEIKKRPSSSASCYQSENSKQDFESQNNVKSNACKLEESLQAEKNKALQPSQKSKQISSKIKDEGSNTVDAKLLGTVPVDEEDLPLGAEAIDQENLEDEEDNEEMASTVRRNSGGYTSYVFIGSSDAQAHSQRDNDVSSVVSGAGSHRSIRSNASSTTSSNKIVVNVKDSGIGTSGCVVLQDGRASNISIVSTESSELDLPNSPEVTQDLTHPAPDLPAKIRGRNGGIISADFVSREPGPMSPSWEMDQERSRGGDLNNELLDDEEEDFVDEADFSPENPRSTRSSINNGNGNGLAGYFTSSIESPSASPSRRGRPPVIRAAERHNRLRQQSTGTNGQNMDQNYDDGQDMLHYDDEAYYQDEQGHQIQPPPRRNRPSSGNYRDEYDINGETYVEDDLLYNEEGAYDPQMHYDDLDYDHEENRYRRHRVVHSGGEEEDMEYVDEEAYPMCQPVMYDSNEEYMDGSEGEHLSGDDDFFDREEELRGYNRQIDFTLHTILEESCEDSSASERSKSRGSSFAGSDGGHSGKRAASHKRHSGPSEMEKYFLYGVGGLAGNEEDEYPPDYSDSAGTPSPQGVSEAIPFSHKGRLLSSAEPQSMDGVAASDRERNTDDSGSVGSESDGKCSPTDPKHKKKKFVPRSKGRGNNSGNDSGTGRITGESDSNNADGDMSPTQSSSDSETFSGYDSSKRSGKKTTKNNRKNSADEGDLSSIAQVQTGNRVKETTIQNPLFNKPETKDNKQSYLEGLASSSNASQSPKISPPITPLPTQIIEVQPVLVEGVDITNNRASPAASNSSGSSENNSLTGQGSFRKHENSVSPPLGLPSGPVRKNKHGSSRDSGFVGSMDDLLRNDPNLQIGGSSGGDSGHSFSDSEGHLNMQPKQKRPLEKLSEMSGENTEEDIISAHPIQSDSYGQQFEGKSYASPCSSNKSSITEPRMKETERKVKSSLSRKDSFNNWSSDEDTNIMMNRMRAFFRNVITTAMGASADSATGIPQSEHSSARHSSNSHERSDSSKGQNKPTQLLVFEEKLTNLMKTVPGINETQLKEVVEYLSSEDTWSDSYDSSDYASSDIDLEAYGISASVDEDDDDLIPDLEQSWLQEQISASCQDIVQNFDEFPAKSPSQPLSINETEDFQRETAFMYQKLMAKMAANKAEKEKEKQSRKKEMNKSPPLSVKVMQCISSRLVALMHEVSSSQSDVEINDLPSQTPKFGLRQTNSNDSTTSSNSSTNNYLVNPKVTAEQSMQRLNKNNSKSEEILDHSLEHSNESPPSSLKKSSSSEYNVWKGANREEMLSKRSSKHSKHSSVPNSNEHLQQISQAHEKASEDHQRRGSLGLPSRNAQATSSNNAINNHGVIDKSISGSSSGMSDIVNDEERWSWKGSFESALATGTIDNNGKRSRNGSSSAMTSNALKKPTSGSAGELYNIGSENGVPDQSRTHSNNSSKRDSIKSSSSTSFNRNDKNSTIETPSFEAPIEAEIVPTYNPSKVQSARFRNSNMPQSKESYSGGPPATYKSTATATLASPSSSSVASSNTNSTQNSSAMASARNHSTNSLPRLGTSAITDKKRSARSCDNGSGMMTPRTVSPDTLPVQTPYKPSTIITTTAAVTLSTTSSGPSHEAQDISNVEKPLKSARYRPPGYRPSPSRKMSSSSRKMSTDSTNSSKYTGKFRSYFQMLLKSG